MQNKADNISLWEIPLETNNVTFLLLWKRVTTEELNLTSRFRSHNNVNFETMSGYNFSWNLSRN